MQHASTVRLETERLLLRRFRECDAEAMFRNWANDPAVTKFLRWPAHTEIAVTQAVLRDWVARYAQSDYYQWAIVPRADGRDEPIGAIGAVEQNDALGIVHIGYCIGRRWWRQGMTSEALARVIPFFFDVVKANRIESQHDPNNPNSGNVMRKCGLQYEGTLRQADFNNQGIVDAARYALLARDYYTNA